MLSKWLETSGEQRAWWTLPCDSAAGTTRVCVFVWGKKDTESALQIIQHQSCQVASTTNQRVGPKQSAGTSCRVKITKQQHNLQPHDDIYENQKPNMIIKMPLWPLWQESLQTFWRILNKYHTSVKNTDWKTMTRLPLPLRLRSMTIWA